MSPDTLANAHPDAVAEVPTGHYVPIIDIVPFLAGDPQGKADVAAAMRDACENIGFLQIIGHGVDPELIDRVYRLSREFFDRPLAEKTPVTAPSPDQVRGYSAVGAEGLSYSLDEVSAGDLKESFTIGPEGIPGDPYFTGPGAGPHFAPNLWPEGAEEFRQAYEEYFGVMAELSEDLMRIFAVALDLDEEFFTPTLDRHISMFRTLNYPDQPDAPAGKPAAGRSALRLRQPDDPAPGERPRRSAGA